MTKLETLENNELIAVFDGAEYVNDAPEEYPDGYYCWDGPPLPEDFEYLTSWDWLMHVVAKIENTKTEEGEFYEVYIVGKECFIHCDSDNITRAHYEETKLGSVCGAVLEFIKWYNDKSRKI